MHSVKTTFMVTQMYLMVKIRDILCNDIYGDILRYFW